MVGGVGDLRPGEPRLGVWRGTLHRNVHISAKESITLRITLPDDCQLHITYRTSYTSALSCRACSTCRVINFSSSTAVSYLYSLHVS